MALTNKASSASKLIVNDVSKIPHKGLDNFLKNVKSNRPYQALFYLINVFWKMENDDCLINKEKEYIENAIYSLGNSVELQFQQLEPDKINNPDLSFVDGVAYGKLISKFEKIIDMANSFEYDTSSSFFADIIEMSIEFRTYRVEFLIIADAIKQLSNAVKDFSIEISQIADYLIYHEIDAIYKANIQIVEDLMIYFNMLDTIWLCLNGIHLSLLDCSICEELSSEIQYNLEDLLAYRLDDLFEREVNLDGIY